MTTETLMTTEAATTTEGEAASNPDTQAATGAAEVVQQQAPADQQTEAQPAEAKPEDGKPQLPESYEFTAPEGVQLHEGAKEAYAEVAKELGLTQEQAQAAFSKLAARGAENQRSQMEAAARAWVEQSTADPEFGGEKLQENLAVSKRALDTFGTPELRNLLNESGLGNHPEVIRFMYRAGKAISEDTVVVGKGPQGGTKNDAKSFYAASNMNP